MRLPPDILRRPARPLANLSEISRREPGEAMERSDEIRQVSKADVECNLADRPAVVDQQTRSAAQAAADEILVRRDPMHPEEEAEKVKDADAGDIGRRLEIDGLVRVRVDPEGGNDRALSIARGGHPRSRDVAARQLREPGREDH